MKKNTYIYVEMIHFAALEANTTLWVNYTPIKLKNFKQWAFFKRNILLPLFTIIIPALSIVPATW